MKLRNAFLLLAATSVLLSACGPTRNQPPQASDREKLRVELPRTAAGAARYATICMDFGAEGTVAVQFIGMIHCRALALSEIANDDQRFIANLRVCQVAKVGSNVDVREGLAHCWKAIELQPEAGEAYSARGLALARSDRFKQSLLDLTKAIKLGEGDDPKIYSARSFVRSALEDYSGGIADAVTARRKYADKGETPPASLFALQSHMHFSADQFSDARAAIAAGRAIKADYPAFYRIEALLEVEDGNLDGWLKAINVAIKQEPKSAASHAIRGIIHGRLGKLEAMAQDYRVAARHNQKATGLAETASKLDAAFALAKEALRTLGHDPGTKGPELTADARNAMLAFQKANDLPLDGRFNEPSITTLLRAADANATSNPQDPLDVIKSLMQEQKAGSGV